MKRYTVEHDNVKAHCETEIEVKDYLDRLGNKTVKVIKHTIVYDRTKTHVKLDNL